MTNLIKNILQKRRIFDQFLNSKTILFFLLITSLFFGKVCFATMAASGPALNEKTKQCGYFYGGDENKLYDVPSGWEVDFQSQKVREKFEQYGFYAGEATIKDCCEKIGYNFVEGNVGDMESRPNVAYLVVVVLFFLILIIFLVEKRINIRQN